MHETRDTDRNQNLLKENTDMAIKGINHLTFIVRDLERTARLFREALGAREVYDAL